MSRNRLASDSDLDIQNTKQMSLAPQRGEAFNMMDTPTNNKLDFYPVFSGAEFRSIVSYPVIVEGWDKRKHGRVGRAWIKEFTQAERNKIGKYYGRFYRWYLISGTPDRVLCKLNTVLLLKRVVNFFATI